MTKYLTEKHTDKGLENDSDQSIDSVNNKEKGKNKKDTQKKDKDKEKVLEWSEATNAMERKLSRVVNKVLAGDMEYTNKVMVVDV